MSKPNNNYNKYISELVDEINSEMDEATVSGDAAGYQTPNAFGNGKERSKKKIKDISTEAGYTIVNESSNPKLTDVPKFNNHTTRTLKTLIHDFNQSNFDGVTDVKIVKNFIQVHFIRKDIYRKDEHMKEIIPFVGSELQPVLQFLSELLAKYKYKLNYNKLGESVNEAMLPKFDSNTIHDIKNLMYRLSDKEFDHIMNVEFTHNYPKYDNVLQVQYKEKSPYGQSGGEWVNVRIENDEKENVLNFLEKYFKKLNYKLNGKLRRESKERGQIAGDSTQAGYEVVTESKYEKNFDNKIPIKVFNNAIANISGKNLTNGGENIPYEHQYVITLLNNKKVVFSKTSDKKYMGYAPTNDALKLMKIMGINEATIPGGLADGMSIEDIANKHKVDIDELVNQFRMGIKVEMEHTTDKNVAKEITLDHLFEDPRYYDKLSTIENESINELGLVTGSIAMVVLAAVIMVSMATLLDDDEDWDDAPKKFQMMLKKMLVLINY